jgi:hypothetical protein
MSELQKAHQGFNLKIEEFFNETTEKFNKLITGNDYSCLLAIYNRKNIASRLSSLFGLSHHELPKFILRLSDDPSNREKFKNAIKNYIPQKLFSLI